MKPGPSVLKFEFEFQAAGVDGTLPLLYLWQVTNALGQVVYRYVGKSETGSHRPLKHYRRNVRNLLNGKPYRKANPNGFREAHHQLAVAVTEEMPVLLRLLCNVPPIENIFAAELRAQQVYCTQPYCALPPNPSIERTATGKPVSAAHVER